MKSATFKTVIALGFATSATAQVRYSDSGEAAGTEDDLSAPWGALPSTDGEPVSPLPETGIHIVQEGETLWTISAQYFGTSDAWSQLWAFNPHITNPHWVYPGDAIRLKASVDLAKVNIADTPTERPGPMVLSTRSGIDASALQTARILEDDVVFAPQQVYVEEAELKVAAELVGGTELKKMFAEFEEAFIKVRPKSKLYPGRRYSIYEIGDEVRHPDTGERLGWLVEIAGTLEVTNEKRGAVSRAKLLTSRREIEIGMRVGPVRTTFRQMQPRRNEASVRSTIVTSVPHTQMLASNMLVVLDRGKNNSVHEGNRFWVVRSGDALDTPLRENAEYPSEVIAEVMIVESKKKSSVGLVTRARREFMVGDIALMKQGY